MRFKVGSTVKLSRDCWMQPEGRVGKVVADDGRATMPYLVRFSPTLTLWIDTCDLTLVDGSTGSNRTFYANCRKRHISKSPISPYDCKLRAVTLEDAYLQMEARRWR